MSVSPTPDAPADAKLDQLCVNTLERKFGFEPDRVVAAVKEVLGKK